MAAATVGHARMIFLFHARNLPNVVCNLLRVDNRSPLRMSRLLTSSSRISSLRALTSVDAHPQLTADTLRIYSMRFCPYAQRARLVAAHKEISFEEVNINLKDKPAWFLQRNPQGTVPVIELNDHVVCDSTICMEFLDATYRQRPLLPQTPYLKARMQMTMGRLDKLADKFFSVFGSDSDNRDAIVEKFQKQLDELETILIEDFFCGSEPLLADYFIWPWFERFPLLDSLHDIDVMPASRYPRLTSWISSMLETPGVKGTYQTVDRHLAYTKTSMSGQPDYDVGL